MCRICRSQVLISYLSENIKYKKSSNIYIYIYIYALLFCIVHNVLFNDLLESRYKKYHGYFTNNNNI